MAGSVNKVILIGNLGRDPEMRRLGSGEPVANLRIATSETWRDKASGERKERTEWHNVVIYNENLSRVAEQYLKKARRSTSRASCRPANGRIRAGRSATPPRWFSSASAGNSPFSTGAARAGAPPWRMITAAAGGRWSRRAAQALAGRRSARPSRPAAAIRSRSTTTSRSDRPTGARIGCVYRGIRSEARSRPSSCAPSSSPSRLSFSFRLRPRSCAARRPSEPRPRRAPRFSSPSRRSCGKPRPRSSTCSASRACSATPWPSSSATTRSSGVSSVTAGRAGRARARPEFRSAPASSCPRTG